MLRNTENLSNNSDLFSNNFFNKKDFVTPSRLTVLEKLNNIKNQENERFNFIYNKNNNNNSSEFFCYNDRNGTAFGLFRNKENQLVPIIISDFKSIKDLIHPKEKGNKIDFPNGIGKGETILPNDGLRTTIHSKEKSPFNSPIYLK